VIYLFGRKYIKKTYLVGADRRLGSFEAMEL
jgi:hypothetical protein